MFRLLSRQRYNPINITPKQPIHKYDHSIAKVDDAMIREWLDTAP